MSRDNNEQLIRVSVGGKLEEMRSLLQQGANPNAKMRDTLPTGMSIPITPLWGAIDQYQVEAVDLLLKFGADPNLALNYPTTEIRKVIHNYTPLHKAVREKPFDFEIVEKRFNIVKLLLDAGADPTAMCEMPVLDGDVDKECTPLKLANGFAFVKLLKEAVREKEEALSRISNTRLPENDLPSDKHTSTPLALAAAGLNFCSYVQRLLPDVLGSQSTSHTPPR